MLLALDLGNTVLKVGLVSKEGRFLREMRFGHSENVSFLKALQQTKWPGNVTEARIASVVPALTGKVVRVLEGSIGIQVKVLAREDLPIKVQVRRPKEVGMDRLLNALAAGRFYGKPAVVIDCGTALTFDLVTRAGNYTGGIIAPSPEISRDYLAEKTALLPIVKLQPPKSVVGKNTDECLRSGLVFGFADLISGLLTRLKKEWQPEFTVVGTGGGLAILLPYLSEKVIFDPNLTLKGIYLTAAHGA
ncbi:MAG: type III pantothenate kinase [Candidatus Omnitrophica bacterium]|nr:type III pantothenate kinase [Candidatus Omnitrophota bacterium]